MNILIIDNSVAYTGAFKCALNEAELLSDKHRFIFVMDEKTTLAPVLQEKGYTVYQLPLMEIRKSIPVLLTYPFRLLSNTLALKKIVRKEQVDAVQVNDFYNMLGVALKATGYKGKLITYVRFLPSVMPGILRTLWVRYGLKYSHRMIAVSDAVLHQLPSDRRTVRIYDPVKLAEALPAKNHKETQPVRLLYLSNYIQGKGQDSAIEAFALAYNTNTNITLTFAGGDMGLGKNALYRQRLEARVKELNLTGVITFASFSSNVEETIKVADIALNFSEAESFSMTCLEAAYYGTALIATRCGGPEEIIADGKTGITVPVKDVDAMKDAILLLAGDAQLREQFAEAGKEYVRNKFSIEHFRQQTEHVFTGE